MSMLSFPLEPMEAMAFGIAFEGACEDLSIGDSSLDVAKASASRISSWDSSAKVRATRRCFVGAQSFTSPTRRSRLVSHPPKMRVLTNVAGSLESLFADPWSRITAILLESRFCRSSPHKKAPPSLTGLNPK